MLRKKELPMNVLLIGNGAREHAIAEAVMRSGRAPALFAYMKSNNPGIAALAERVSLGSYDDLKAIKEWAKLNAIRFAVIGPEDPLNNGVADALQEAGIPSVGPMKSLARLETSKAFTRNLLEKYQIPGNPEFRNFTSPAGIEAFLEGLEGVVIKPDGLTGGKGVMVQGDHFASPAEAVAICTSILAEHGSVTIEEKLEGEEYSLQCLTDGKTVVATPPVQDHKRRFNDDKGPNTGGMGSYSCADHSLPFLERKDVEEGLAITEQVAAAIYRETGEYYRGVMYGGFMITKQGLRLLEYNARFGDPETMNILPLLKTDFIDICQAIIEGELKGLKIEFEEKATVCKYIVPNAYGLPEDGADASSRPGKIEIGPLEGARLYYSSVDKRADGLYMTQSRAIGIVGVADGLPEAEAIAEKATAAIKGAVSHRSDIGTAALIEKRVRHMQELRRFS
jgi:phosphoribosylamine--glycine ligase